MRQCEMVRPTMGRRRFQRRSAKSWLVRLVLAEPPIAVVNSPASQLTVGEAFEDFSLHQDKFAA